MSDEQQRAQWEAEAHEEARAAAEEAEASSIDAPPCSAENPYKNGERKLLEITAGEPSNSRFSVCFYLDGEWVFDDRPGFTPTSRGYSVVAIHDLPRRTYPPNTDLRHGAEPLPPRNGSPNL